MNEAGPALYIHQDPSGEIQEPFRGDLFDRRALAGQLEQHVTRLSNGGVFAIEAAWGDGKTWAARNWAADLQQKDFKVVYIDAFNSDYIEDAFVLLTAEIVDTLKKTDQPDTEKLTAAGKRVGKALLPIAAKVAAGAASRFVFGSAGALDDIKEAVESANEGLADLAEKAVEKRLDDYAKDKASVQHFREVLATLARASGKPIIVMIDELDRCKPSFAVHVLERIKHFFDAPNVVFVLFLNREQLIAAVRGMYGAGVDADSYLRKFLQFTLTLPKVRGRTGNNRSFNLLFCEATLRLYGFPLNTNDGTFADVLALIADHFALSLRDIERGVILYALAQTIKGSSSVAAWLICLKLARPDIFAGILRGERNAHQNAALLANELKKNFARHGFTEGIASLHEAVFHGSDEPKDDEGRQLFSMMNGVNYGSVKRLIELTAKRLDLALVD